MDLESQLMNMHIYKLIGLDSDIDHKYYKFEEGKTFGVVVCSKARGFSSHKQTCSQRIEAHTFKNKIINACRSSASVTLCYYTRR